MSVWVRVLGAVVVALLRGLPLPASARRRRQAVVCSAADVLSAFGVRVEVHASAVAWPRAGTGRLVVSNRIGRLDDLALLTAVPGTAVAGSELASWPVAGRLLRRADAVVGDVAARLRSGGTVLVHPEGPPSGPALDRFRPAVFEAAVETSAAVCPVAIRHRADPGGPVVEVHLLPALDPAGTDRRTLAALAEYAVAEVVEAGVSDQRSRRSQAVVGTAH